MKRSQIVFLVVIAIAVFWNSFGVRFGEPIHHDVLLPIAIAALAASAWQMRDWWKGFARPRL